MNPQDIVEGVADELSNFVKKVMAKLTGDTTLIALRKEKKPKQH